jgi:hypothetical protein
MIVPFSFPVNGMTTESSETNKVADGNKVLFVRNNGYFSSFNAYSEMAAYFTAEGYVVEEVQSEINDTVLENVGILFVNTYQASQFDQNETSTIESFVHSGGGLIMSMVGGGLDFGVKLASNLGVINSHTLEINPSPGVDSLPTPFINTSSAVFEIILSGTGQAAITTDAGSSLPNIPIIAVNSFGEGKILVSAIGTIWVDTYWNTGGNSDLIKNYLSWFETEGVKKVIFARNNGYFSPSSAYSQMAALFDTYGYFVEEVSSEINETVLVGVSFLFVNTYQVTGFNQSEKAAIESFVYSGGGLIMSASGGGLNFGVQLSSSLGLINSHTLELYPNPVTTNIPMPIINPSSGFVDVNLNGTGQAVVTTDPSSTLPNATVIATNYHGEGKILVSAVSTIWDNNFWNDGGNNDLIENYLRWFEAEGVKNFVFAKNNGYFSPMNAYGELANYFASMGYLITELIDEEPTVELLSTTDILLVNSYQTPATSAVSEAAVEDWVSNGGSLIIVRSGFAIDFGLHLYSFGLPELIYDNDSYHIHYHPVTAGVTDVTITAHSGLAKFDVADTATVVVSTTADSNSPERPIIAVNHYQQGRVMGFAVGSIWDENLDFNQNTELIKNFLDWISVNTTTPAPWISEHPDFSYDERSVGNSLSWTMSSYYPYYYQVFLDSAEYLSGTWSTYPLTVDVDGLRPGTYTFSIHIYDHYGRTVVDSVDVTVNEVIDSDTTDTNETSDSGSSTPFSAMAMITAMIVASILGGYKRRKKY